MPPALIKRFDQERKAEQLISCAAFCLISTTNYIVRFLLRLSQTYDPRRNNDSVIVQTALIMFLANLHGPTVAASRNAINFIISCFI